MRLVADEKVPLKAVHLLRKNGHDVLSICESLPQTADEDILAIVEVIESRSDWAGHFTVVEPGRIRMRTL